MPPESYYSAAMAHAIIEATTTPLLLLDADFVVRQCNSAFLKAFQVSRGETDGQLITQLGNGQWNIPELQELLDEIRTKREPVREYLVEQEFQNIGRRIMLLSGTPIASEESVESILLTIDDITEREQMRFELEGQKEYAEKIVDASREALLILGWDLRVRTANETFYDSFQVNKAETAGRLLYELGNGQWNIPRLRELLEKVLPENESFDDFEVEHDFESIGHRVMLLNARKINHLQLILLAIEDVTERRQYETAIGASEQRLRDVLETEAVGVLFFEPTGTLFDCNESFVKMTGYAREDIRARRLHWRDLTPSEWIESSEAQMEKLAETGRIGPYEKQYVLKDGSKSWMICAGRRLGDGTVVKFCIDIADRKKAEEERELLAAELIHRVKNTLAVVQALAVQTARDARSIDEFRTAFLGRLQALSRAHSLLIEAQWQTADLRMLVEQAVDVYRVDDAKVVEIEGEQVTVSAKKSMGLTLILHELSTNAIKYGALSQHDGCVNVSWQVDAQEDGRFVHLTWRERDGPPVISQMGKGLGFELIEGISEYELGGKAKLDFRPSGLVFTLSFSVP